MEEQILSERRGNTIWLTLNRPAASNALTHEIIGGLEQAMDEVDSGSGIQALVLTGNGPAFCAGADLKSILASSKTDNADIALDAFVSRVGRAFNRLEKLRVPTVAALNGITMAGGLEMSLCCDFIIADAKVKIGDGHSKFAQIPGAGAHYRLPKRIGMAHAKRLFFSGRLWSAEVAMANGLIDEIAEENKLAETVDGFLSDIINKSPLVLSRMKTLTIEGDEQTRDLALASEARMVAWHGSSEDRNEGLRAFAEKRKPSYVGR